MECPKCGAEISDDSDFCNKCGRKVKKENRDSIECSTQDMNTLRSVKKDSSSITNKIKMNGKSKKAIIAVSATILLLVIGACFFYPIGKYQYALHLYETKNYINAAAVFKELNGYSNSNNMIKQCKYMQANKDVDKSKYDDAIKLYNSLKNYKDSENLAQNANYLLAKKYLDEKDYFNAISILKSLDYKDSKTLLQEATYQDGIKSYNVKDYQAAYNEFITIKSYKDSASVLAESTYQLACQQYKNGIFDRTKELFSQIQDYKDSKQLLANANSLSQFQGTWRMGDSYVIVINRWKISKSVLDKTFDFNLSFVNGVLTDTFDNYTISNDKLTDKEINYAGYPNIYKKVSNSTIVQQEQPTPEIGMTEQQVLDSSWGKPISINRTTTASVTHEQWCYSGNKYIYIDNGIVTAIQDH